MDALSARLCRFVPLLILGKEKLELPRKNAGNAKKRSWSRNQPGLWPHPMAELRRGVSPHIKTFSLCSLRSFAANSTAGLGINGGGQNETDVRSSPPGPALQAAEGPLVLSLHHPSARRGAAGELPGPGARRLPTRRPCASRTHQARSGTLRSHRDGTARSRAPGEEAPRCRSSRRPRQSLWRER